MSRDPFDLDVYLQRIGLTRADVEAHAPGSRARLHAIAWAHATHIPFENLSTLYPAMRQVPQGQAGDVPRKHEGLPLRASLEPAGIYRKLVLSKRGGFCFEQNLLLARALREASFDVDLIAAKGVNRAAAETREGLPLSCFTHLVLIATTADGRRHLLDNGFGWAGAPREPLELSAGVVVEDQNTRELFRLVRGDEIPATDEGLERWGCHRVRVGTAGAEDKAHPAESTGWFLQYKPNAEAAAYWDMYHFRSDGFVSAMDCEPGAWYASTHPAHKQTQMKLVALMTDEGRVSLVDDLLTVRENGAIVYEQQLDPARDPGELARVLAQRFGIAFEG